MGRGRGGGGGKPRGGRGGRGNRFRKRDFKEKRPDEWDERHNKRFRKDVNGYTVPLTMENAAFEDYYKRQGIVEETEWEDFMTALRTPLPLTFRINGAGAFADSLREKLKKDFLSDFSDEPLEVDGEVIAPPRPLKWYPRELAWQLSFSRKQLRKVPHLESIHEFMKVQNDAGGITRQEAVSMVPPLFLDVRPEHRVLDMCAAPGSKTVQLIEMLHAGQGVPPGLVVANDADTQRCNLLTHQTKRLCSPCMLITNHEAQNFPVVSAPDGSPLQFDRILCDVPCSGDGTLRKNTDIWRRFTAHNANGLHVLQLRITLQACRLLKPGGRLVYSTCSFNPVEDEAVVAEVLRRCKGAMELVDVSRELPALARCAGKTKWVVRDKAQYWEEWNDETQHKAWKLEPSMFPHADTADMPLHHTMRFLPHHSDTGGFFVAVLRKTREIPDLSQLVVHPARRAPPKGAAGASAGDKTEDEKPEVNDDEGGKAIDTADAGDAEEDCNADAPDDAPKEEEPAAGAGADDADKPLPGARGGGGRGGRQGGKHKGLDPVMPVCDPEMLAKVRDFYGLSDGINLETQLVTRSTGEAVARPKKVYVISREIKDLLAMDRTERMKITALGVKVFERQEAKTPEGCSYRIAQEGLPLILPYITKQKVFVSAEEFARLLDQRVVPVLQEGGKNEPDDQGRMPLSNPHTLEQLKRARGGCCVVFLKDDDAKALGYVTSDRSDDAHGLAAASPLAIACWRGVGSVSILVNKADAKMMLERLRDAMKDLEGKTEAAKA
ncbi:unnamed protein product [Pedinophyceae sp. YPF-701]|nr:unnamed protein product [Pedinophyceae sp. YPF-701]